MTQIAAQLFTIREFTKTRKDFAASMVKIRNIGYQARAGITDRGYFRC